MIRYVTLGTNDLARARAFYDAVLATLGHLRLADAKAEVGYGPPGAAPVPFWIVTPFDGQPASRGNGSMTALAAASRAEVRAFHAAALSHGGTDEGTPGPRPYSPGFYAAFVRDPDGNKLSAVHVGEE
ncbi:MAG: VOC family protein [Paracoccaceae bacterium]